MASSSFTNYPTGYAGGVDVAGSSLLSIYGGNVYWVNSATGNNNTKGTRERPVATIDEATTLCTANNGDVVMIMENHAETITGVGGIAFDKAGVTYIGLGTFANRPRFLMDGADTVTAVVSAADVKIENMVFASGHADVATCFGVTASGLCLKKIEFEDNTTDENFLACVTATGTTDEEASGLAVIGCRYVSLDVGPTDFISLTADVTNLVVADNFYCVDAATGAGLIIVATGKDIRGLQCFRNAFICGNTANPLMINCDTSVNTGATGWNLVGHHDTAGMRNSDCDGIREFENYTASEDTTSGLLRPIVDDNT